MSKTKQYLKKKKNKNKKKPITIYTDKYFVAETFFFPPWCDTHGKNVTKA